MEVEEAAIQGETADWNTAFSPLSPIDRMTRLFELFSAEEILVTSSFGTSSALLLYVLHQVAPGHPIYFIDTQYHFPETLAYKQHLTELWSLNVIDILPPAHLNTRSRKEEWWKKYPDRCCYVNKVLPLEAVQVGHKVWISGLMAFQNEYRAHLPVFEGKTGLVKFQPLIDIEPHRYHACVEELQLPVHPLGQQGFGSVGCTHCTTRGEGRNGRWAGSSKTECGLHL